MTRAEIIVSRNYRTFHIIKKISYGTSNIQYLDILKASDLF